VGVEVQIVAPLDQPHEEDFPGIVLKKEHIPAVVGLPRPFDESNSRANGRLSRP
jgi:hypothetical protein